MSELTSEESVASSQFLTFTSSGQDYAIPIMRMKEIVPYVTSTRVPLVPNEIRGLINLRGRAIPVVDLAVRFGGDETRVTNRTCVLIVDLEDEQGRPDMGILADSVSRVIDLDPGEVEEAPEFGVGVASHLLLGMAKQGDQFIPIVDVEQVLEPDRVRDAFSAAGAEDSTHEAVEEALVAEPETGMEAEPETEAEAETEAETEAEADAESTNAG